jgi:hypothetical protein
MTENFVLYPTQNIQAQHHRLPSIVKYTPEQQYSNTMGGHQSICGRESRLQHDQEEHSDSGQAGDNSRRWDVVDSMAINVRDL